MSFLTATSTKINSLHITNIWDKLYIYSTWSSNEQKHNKILRELEHYFSKTVMFEPRTISSKISKDLK